MDGFDAGQVKIPAPPVEVAEGTRETLIAVVAAIAAWRTPEQIVEILEGRESGGDFAKELGLERDGMREEISAHVDILLTVLQSPEGG